MAQRPTEDQWTAITALHGHVAVTAGAGSGKTWVLTERYAAMLRGRPVVPPPEGVVPPDPVEPCRPGQIVAITFTEAAAADMRLKIRTRLYELIEGGEIWLASHLEELERAPISTIHSYCASMIRRYPFEAGVDPDFTILDEKDARRLLAEAAEEVVTEALEEEHPAVSRALLAYGRAGVTSLVLGIGQALREEGRSGADAWERTREALSREEAQWPECRERLLDAGRRMASSLDVVPRKSKSYEKVVLFAQKWASAEERLREWDGLVTEEWEEFLRQIDKEYWSGQPVKGIKEAVDAWRTAVKDVVEGVRHADLADVTFGVCLLWDRIAARYAEKKRRIRALDFTDLQEIAVRLLEREDLSADWTSRLRYVMVDEFQDTNRLQARLVTLLLRGGARLFVVGDQKQSIYRFRGADVEVFAKTSCDIEEGGGLTVSLRHNFRTQRSVLEFVNRVFSRVMGANGGDGVKGPPTVSFEALIPTREAREGSVEVYHVPLGGLQGRFVEASALAHWIQEAVSGKVAVMEGDSPRPARYGDMAVLLATTTHLPVYEAALQERGIPYRIVGSRNFFRRQEVWDLIHLLKWIHDPADVVAMIGALRSPLFGMSDEGLYALTAAGVIAEPGAVDSGDLGSRVTLHPWDRQVWTAALDRVEKWRQQSAYEPVGALLEQIVDETALIPTLLQTTGGDQKAANVRRLIDTAYEAQSAGFGYLPLFLPWVEWQLEEDVDEEEAQASYEDGDVVTIMTVHKSKGLEFPVVLVPDLARRFRSGREMWCFDENGALALKWPGVGDYSGFGWYRRVQARERLKDREEEKRKFYVALTRARDHLVLFAARELPPENRDPLTPETAASWFDWLVCALGDGDVRKIPEMAADWPQEFRWTTVDPACLPAVGTEGAWSETVQEEVRERSQAVFSIEGVGEGWDRAEFLGYSKGGPMGRPLMATVSASQLLEYEICPRRYYYHWYLRLPSLEEVLIDGREAASDSLEEWELLEGGDPALSLSEGGWSPLFRGIVVHRVCERWTGTEPILDRLHQVLEEFSFPKELRDRAEEELADELVRYAESDLAEWLRRASTVWSEWPFYLRLKGRNRTWDVHGQVDKIVSVDGRLILVDYKTNRVAGEDLDRLAKHYRWQVHLYAWAVGRSLGPVDEAYLYFTDPGVLWAVDVRPSTVEDTLVRVDDRLQMLSHQWNMEAYPFTEDPTFCRVCPYRAICPGAVR